MLRSTEPKAEVNRLLAKVNTVLTKIISFMFLFQCVQKLLKKKTLIFKNTEDGKYK